MGINIPFANWIIKRKIAVFLCVLMAFSSITFSGAGTTATAIFEKDFDGIKAVAVYEDSISASTVASTGTCGTYATFVYFSDGSVVISGKGEIKEKAFYNRDYINKVVIGDGITKIGKDAFSFCDALVSVTLSSGVEEIDYGAFQYSEKLTNIENLSSVKSIGKYAFSKTAIRTFEIPSKLENLGAYAFAQCGYLTSFSVNENNPYFSADNGVLFNKDKTALVAYPCGRSNASYSVKSSVSEIKEGAFYYCLNLKNIIFNKGLKSIGNSAFGGCQNISSVTFPDSVEHIGDGAFGYCLSLREVAFSKNLKTIGSYAFAFASFSSFVLPRGIESIGNFAVCYTFADELEFKVPITGFPGTAAEKYAKENGLVFIDLLHPTFADEKFTLNGNILSGVGEKFSVSELGEKVSVPCWEVKNYKGETLFDEEFVGTGAVISVYAFGETTNETTVVVKGDTDGDGEITSTDYLRIKKAFMNEISLEGAFYLASDTDGDNEITTTDYLRIKGYFLGEYDLYS